MLPRTVSGFRERMPTVPASFWDPEASSCPPFAPLQGLPPSLSCTGAALRFVLTHVPWCCLGRLVFPLFQLGHAPCSAQEELTPGVSGCVLQSLNASPRAAGCRDLIRPQAQDIPSARGPGSQDGACSIIGNPGTGTWVKVIQLPGLRPGTGQEMGMERGSSSLRPHSAFQGKAGTSLVCQW